MGNPTGRICSCPWKQSSISATVPDVLDAGDHDGSEQQEGEEVAVADEDGGVAAAASAKPDLRSPVCQDEEDRRRGARGEAGQ